MGGKSPRGYPLPRRIIAVVIGGVMMAAARLARRGWRICANFGAGAAGRGVGFSFAPAAFAFAFAFAFALSAFVASPASAQLFTDDDARARLDEHQRQLRQFAAHIVEIRQQRGKLGEQLQAANEQLAQISEKLGATNQQLGRISQRLQNTEAEVRALRGAQQEQAEVARRERAGENTALQNRIITAEEQLAQMQELLEGTRGLLDSLRRESAGVSHDVAELFRLVEFPPEQELYDAAFSEFQNRRYQSALDGFRRVQKFYPDGKFQVNVGYWISNALLSLGDYEAVVVAGRDLLLRHPGSDKTPDVMLVMARALSQLGREEESRQMLQRIIDEHATSLAADKARQEL